VKEAKRALEVQSVKSVYGGSWRWGTPEQARALAKESR